MGLEKGCDIINIFDKLKERGFDTVPESFYTQIGVWKSWYDGDVKSFHRYKVYNGVSHVLCHRYTMGMAKKVSEDWANLLMNEKVSITLEGEKEQRFFDAVCKENNFLVNVNAMQEMKSALGTTAYVPRVVGATVNADTGELTGTAQAIKIDYCIAPAIFPLSWENGKVTECAFATRKTIQNDNYLYLQIHRLVRTTREAMNSSHTIQNKILLADIAETGEYVIENVFFRDQNGNLSEVDKGTVPGFEAVPDVVHTASDKPQFVIDRLNIANNVDVSLPMGIAVFANSIDQLKGVDVAYDSYVNEFVLGKKRIMVKPEATKNLDGEPFFDSNDTVFYVLPEDSQNGSIVDQIDMSLRTQEHNAGIQDMLNILSSKCGFGENHYKYDNGNVSTATQIVSENSTLFRNIKKHEIILEDVLEELARIILRLGNTYMNAGLNEDVEISIDFDDSIIEDKQTERANDRQDVAMGVMNDWEYRAKWYNEDEKTAKAALPKMEDMVTEEQDEVE